jgi:hypothetical protein
LARWLAARGVEAHVIHASSVAVSREGIVNLADSGRLRAGSTIGGQRTFRPEPLRHRHNEHTTDG